MDGLIKNINKVVMLSQWNYDEQLHDRLRNVFMIIIRSEHMINYSANTNVLIALKNILVSGVNTMRSVTDHKSNNIINSAGDLLEYYVKDSFGGDSANMTTTNDKLTQ